jgi:hypothetical protein
VLIIGGGSSHNSASFGATDGATLSAAGFSVNYTEDRDQAAAELARPMGRVSVNRQFRYAWRPQVLDFAAAGKARLPIPT